MYVTVEWLIMYVTETSQLSLAYAFVLKCASFPLWPFTFKTQLKLKIITNLGVSSLPNVNHFYLGGTVSFYYYQYLDFFKASIVAASGQFQISFHKILTLILFKFMNCHPAKLANQCAA